MMDDERVAEVDKPLAERKTLVELLRAHNVRSPLNDGLDWHAADAWWDARQEREWDRDD
jgi:hypothetical protein